MNKVIKLGDSIVSLIISQKGDSKITYINLHENETTSVTVGKKIIEKYGGCLIEVKAQGQRLISFSLEGKEYQFDPNRIFSDEGIKETLNESNGKAFEVIKKFREELLAILNKSNLIIALHNNEGGEFSLDSFPQFKISRCNGPHEFFYTTDLRLFNSLKSQFSIVLQDNQIVEDDGSLSIYCGKNNISYINVEARYDCYKEQLKMLEGLQKEISKI
ncbi:MAG: hypothetical protein Q8Q01_05635 [archaeon]|nr:hypothetical protein [archaeon]